MMISSLRFVYGNCHILRSTAEILSPEIKRQRINLMAERCVSGEFGGSALLATRSPTTARMGISRGAIRRQMDRIDPAALADRMADLERVATETAAAEERVTLLSLSLWSEEDQLQQRRHWIR